MNFVLDKDKAAQYGIDRVPAIAVLGQDERRRAARTRASGFSARRPATSSSRWCRPILLVGGAGSTLTDDNRRRIAAVDKPVTMQVFTTPT